MTNDHFLDLIVDGVKKRIGDQPWFQGVLLSTIKYGMELGEAIDSATRETIFRDSPYLSGEDLYPEASALDEIGYSLAPFYRRN